MTDDDAAYALCASLNWRCRCAEAERPPCESILDLVMNGITADDERDRMEEERLAE